MIGHCKAASLLCKTMCEQYVPNLLQTILQCFMMALFLRGGAQQMAGTGNLIPRKLLVLDSCQ